MHRSIGFIIAALTASVASAQLPFDVPPINYSSTAPHDPVATLRHSVDSGDVVLDKDSKYGYLVALLKELEIPVSSQTLVFAKTSMQRHLISPSNPRAIYFNDETYVAWIPDGELIEISSTDPMLGTVFYTIEQNERDTPTRLQRRTERCLFCHASTDTGRVPGLLMQSVFTSSDGHRAYPPDSIWPKADGPLRTRWAGWFVTGKHGQQQHLGNLMVDSTDTVHEGGTSGNGNVDDLSEWFNVTGYLSPHSDLVALLVLQHQVSMHNLLTDTNHRARKYLHEVAIRNRKNDRTETYLSDEDALILDQMSERLVDGLLMVDSIQFSEPVSGTSNFAEEFQSQGPRDTKGRSLREFDLQRGVFRYPCSYLIYSESFDALPASILSNTSRRLSDVLTSKDKRKKYNHLTGSIRTAVLQILKETKPDWPK
ncbi:MAG: hypothetical protein HKN47_26505 [Pirellulaceae bacterium]|nr:hypothetical protein [Pirellulaceae bacterium]